MNTNSYVPLTGIIFNIQRFCLDDGPGIRTTVFLKGCYLHCFWCHNPESMTLSPQLSYTAARCGGCGQCVTACTSGVHSFVDGVHRVDFAACITCGDCVAACPTGALSIIGKQMTVTAVLTEVMKDAPYYAESGGGLTLSGGEPLYQFEFALALLRQAKALGLDTAVETSGIAPQAHYTAVLPFVDHFLFDIKHEDAQVHQKVTGISNAPILANLDWLYRHGAEITLRCPQIPRVNETAVFAQFITDLQAKYPNLAGVDWLPYHEMGVEKQAQIGQ